jgi:hypothetical protein
MLNSMARTESDREDLLRDATALAERIELAPAEAGADEHVVIGFRAEGAVSVYFGAEPVYQFNTANQLRRAYCDGRLFKAVRGRLVALERVRREREVQLLRHELTDDEQAVFISRMRGRLSDLVGQLDAGRVDVIGQVPVDKDVLERVRAWFACYDSDLAGSRRLPEVARTPHVRAATGEQCG